MKWFRDDRRQVNSKFHWIVTYLVPVLALIVAAGSLVFGKLSYDYATGIASREIITIGAVYENDFYFDGEILSKDIVISITNNSYVPVSITSLSLKRGIEETCHYSTVSADFLPLNLDVSATEVICIHYPFNISPAEKSELMSRFGTDIEIDTYVLETYLSDGTWVEPNPSIECRPSLQIEVGTARGAIATFASGSGASMKF